MVAKRIKSMKFSEYFNRQKNTVVTYKLTPNISLQNNQNHKMWRMISKMYEVYESAPSRITRNGFHFTYREKDNIWFDTIFRQVDGKKTIEFYVSTSETMAKKLRDVIEQYMKVTVEQVEMDVLAVPEKSNLVEMELARHDIFSLRSNATEQTSPIGSIMNALNDIEEDGDIARLSVCTELMNRKTWMKNAEWAHDKLNKGSVPKRARITTGSVLSVIGKGLVVFLNELYDLINDTLNAFSNVFFKSEKSFEKKEAISKRKVLADEILSNRMSSKSVDKVNQPVWKTYFRIAAHTSNDLRTKLILNTIAGASVEIAEDNELIPVKIRMRGRRNQVINELNTLTLSKRTQANGDVSLLSCDELSKVSLQLPTATLQTKFEDVLTVNKKVETDIPSIFINKEVNEHVEIDGIKIRVGSNNIRVNEKKVRVRQLKSNSILIGHSETNGVINPIGIPTSNPQEFYKGYVALGGMGSGKDTWIQNFVTEGVLKHNISFVAIDQVNKEGREGMANGIRDSLPPEKIIDIDLSNEDYLPPLDLTEVMEKLGRKGSDRFANELIDFFGDMESMGQSRKLFRDFAKASNGSLYNIKRLLEQEDFREETVLRLEKTDPRLAKEIAKYQSEFEEVVKTDKDGNVISSTMKCVKDGQKLLDGKASALYNRLDEFFGDSTLFEVFAQPAKKELNLEQWMKEGKAIIFRVPDRILSTVAVRTLVHWITLKVLMTRLLMSTADQSNGTFMIFNEPQTYLSGNQGLAKLLARIAVQGRKEKMGSIFACHHLGQLKEIEYDLISGGVNWMLFKSDNKETFKKLENQLQPIGVETALNIPNTTNTRHAICILNFGGERKPAFMVQTLKPSYIRYQPYDNSFLTLRHAKMYGRRTDEIEKLLDEKSYATA